jgi:hypothetical protein
LRPVRDEPASGTAESGNYAFQRGGPTLSGRSPKRNVSEISYEPCGKFPVATPADYRKVALTAEEIHDSRIGEMPGSWDFGSFDLIKGPVIFFPNDLKPTGPVEKSQGHGGKRRQKWHGFRNTSAFLQFIVYI